MTETKHTPGPWVSKLDIDGRRVVVLDDNYQIYIADENCEYVDEIDANAALIAQAPDLLAENERFKRLVDAIKAAHTALNMGTIETEDRMAIDLLAALIAELEVGG